MTKVCSGCGEEKEYAEFHRDKSKADGHHGQCKLCRIASQSLYYASNAAAIKKRQRTYNAANRERIAAANYAHWRKTPEKNKAYHLKYREEHREEIRAKAKIRQKKRRPQTREYMRKHYRANIDYKLGMNLRNRLRTALERGYKKSSALKLLGCSIDEFKAYMAAQFSDGMSWDNHGEWHIDHIKPCASFDLTKEAEQQVCFHFTNMQPLWAIDNLIKGSRYERRS